MTARRRVRGLQLQLLAALLTTSVSRTSAGHGTPSSFFVWHITDVHVDPWYTVGSNAFGSGVAELNPQYRQA